MTGSPPRDSNDLIEFPAFAVEPGTSLYRMHAAKHGAIHFSGYDDQRFSPAYGTCYLADSAEGSFIEKFLRISASGIINVERVQQTRLTELTPARSLKLADLTVRPASKFEVDQDLAQGSDYTNPQAWAAKFQMVGFDGIYYRARHDNAGQSNSLAVFGTPRSGPSLLTEKQTTPVSRELIDTIQRECGVAVVPPTPLAATPGDHTET